MKKIICLVLLCLGLLGMSACGQENQKLDKILKKGQITIITSPDYAPFEFIDDSKTGDNKYVGSDIQLMKYIASKLGVTLKIEVADFNTTLASLSMGKVDLAISGYTYKLERANNYEMSKSYYEEGTQGILILKENLSTFGTFQQLNVSAVQVGAQAGSLQADYVEDQLETAKIKLFDTIPNGILFLDNGTIKGIALASKVAELIVSKHPNKYIFIEDKFEVSAEESQLFIFAKKGETALITKINEIIQEVIDNNLYEQWDKEATELAMSLGLL